MALPGLTWRRFLTLTRGLGPNSATSTQVTARNYVGGKRREQVNEVTTRAGAQAAFEAIHAGAVRQPVG